MRPFGVILAVLLGASTAHAQFANKSIGLSVGYFDLNDADALENAIPIGLVGSLYIESGFDLVAHFGIMIVRDRLSGRSVVGISPSLGIRYLFSEESLRPYLGVDLSYLGVFRGVSSHYVGLGPNAGLDVFVGDSISLGVRAVANVYLTLNRPTQLSYGAQFIAATYF